MLGALWFFFCLGAYVVSVFVGGFGCFLWVLVGCCGTLILFFLILSFFFGGSFESLFVIFLGCLWILIFACGLKPLNRPGRRNETQCFSFESQPFGATCFICFIYNFHH